MQSPYTEDDMRLTLSSSLSMQDSGRGVTSLHSSYEMISQGENLDLSPGQEEPAVDEDTPLIQTSTPGRRHSRSPAIPDPRWTDFRRFRSMTVSMTMSLVERESFDRQASALLAGWNVTNLIQGMGILGIPYAVKEGGIAGACCIFIVALFCDVTGILLVDCLYEYSPRSKKRKRVRTNYPEVGDAVWPRVGGTVVSIIQTVELYAAAVLYLVLLTTMFHQVTKKFVSLTLQEWAVVCACAVLPSIFIRRLSLIAWMSMIAVFSLMGAIAVTVAYCIVHSYEWKSDNIPAFNGSTFPVGFGIVTFSYCAHAVFPGIEASMKEPHKYNMMMHASFILSAVVKTIFGVLCVLTFGLATDQVVTLNMADSIAFNTAATVLVALNVFFSFPLPLFVVIETIDDVWLPHFPHLSQDTRYHWFWVLLTRVLLVTLALFIALVVPHFGLLMGFVGSFTGTCLSFGFPCIAHLKLKWGYLRWYHVVGEILLIVFGVIAGAFGLVYSGKALVDSFKGF